MAIKAFYLFPLHLVLLIHSVAEVATTFGVRITDVVCPVRRSSPPSALHSQDVPIALADYEPEVDVTAYITGWGVLTSSVALDYADELQAHTAVIMERNACNATYECEIYGEGCVTENMICTTEKPWCTGDGGGPLVINNIQYGIASWGYTCGPGYPGVYANVAALRAWVNQTTGV
ncbi:trypsin alpha-3-like [Schistocerca serialis cubense]|uniref:trypsin alpha-3-like n=1 Tax=Schistocerca serialis cubense TaxID=2023355 RepID=UPI00214F29A8|nr:trypsin alpha-3-like [Schistocerca serialis cubense]